MGARALTAIACAAAVAVACASRRPESAPANAPTSAQAPSTAAVGGSAPPGAPTVADVDASLALDLAPAEGEIVIRPDVLRAHPVGAQAAPAFRLWPGWRETLATIVGDPVADLDWIDVVGPTDPGGERLLAGTASATADAAVDGRLVAAQARSAEPADAHVEAGLPAAAARLDGVLRVAFRPQARLVAAVPVARGPALSRLLARSHVEPPPGEDLEALRADIPSPHAAVRIVPDSIRRLRARVLALPNGDADGQATGTCDSPDDAARAATQLRDALARRNSPVVRMVTRGLLDGVAVRADGSTVELRVHATRAQLEALLALVAGLSND